MAGSKMHEGEVHIDVELVRRLVAQQFPHWSGLIVEPAESTGTVNAIYRLGSDMYLRLPRVEAWAQDLMKELHWLPSLAGHLSLEIPEPLAEGHPAFGYPFEWAIYRWLDGSTYAPDSIGSERDAAAELARFVSELRAIDSSRGPRSRRDAPLRLRDPQVQAFIQSLDGEVDGEAAMAVWRRSLKAPEWDGVSVWTHGDLLPPNLLVRDGRISAVIDFGSIGLGDPAVDVIPAWTVFGEEGRKTFRPSLDVDDDTWTRARGFALHQALLIIPYYQESNPAFTAMARRTVDQLLADSNA
jgi:aminoglycoside phosphotransferase (APT) family kinase protein